MMTGKMKYTGKILNNLNCIFCITRVILILSTSCFKQNLLISSDNVKVTGVAGRSEPVTICGVLPRGLSIQSESDRLTVEFSSEEGSTGQGFNIEIGGMRGSC